MSTWILIKHKKQAITTTIITTNNEQIKIQILNFKNVNKQNSRKFSRHLQRLSTFYFWQAD